MKLSKRSKRLIGQGMFQIKAKAKEPGLLHFEIGDSSFNSPKKVKKACIKAIKQNKTHYTDPLGLQKLREDIAMWRGVNIENVAVVPANFGIFASLSILCNRGDKINYPIPGFPTYKAVASYLGLKKNKKSDVKIVNTPNNPTGDTFCDEKGKTLIIDHTYADMIYDNSSRSFTYENKIEIYSFSKSHAMAGYRLGYMIGSKEFIEKVGLLIETTYSCLPEFIQYAGIKSLKIYDYKTKELVKRRNLMFKILIKHYDLELPKGGIYCWCRLCKATTSGNEEFERLLKKGIVVCPGEVFGDKNYIRFCFAKPIKDIKKLGELL